MLLRDWVKSVPITRIKCGTTFTFLPCISLMLYCLVGAGVDDIWANTLRGGDGGA